MLWHFLRYLVSITEPTFYKRIQAKNVKQFVDVKGPVILAMNHPNAFTDPICFTYVAYPVRTYYLARGDAFKPGLISRMLENIGIVPIYRIQDGGKEGLKKNDETYKRVNELLKQKNAKIMVFAEGLCIQERRLRPLKKGVARMVFGAQEYLGDTELTVVPVGLNYSNPNKFRSTLFYNVGEPIRVSGFMELYAQNPARANNAFLQELEPRMKKLITHINDKQFDKSVGYIEQLVKKDWIRGEGLNPKNLEHDYQITSKIVDLVNQLSESETERLKTWQNKASHYFNELKQKGLRDWLLNPNNKDTVNKTSLVLRILGLITGYLLYVPALVSNYLPYKLTEQLTKKLVKRNVEFYSSIAIGLGTFVFLIWYVLLILISWSLLPNIGYALLIAFLSMCFGWYGLHFYFYKLKTLGMWRFLKNRSGFANLESERVALMTEWQALCLECSRS